jgi:hypothetical protein
MLALWGGEASKGKVLLRYSSVSFTGTNCEFLIDFLRKREGSFHFFHITKSTTCNTGESVSLFFTSCLAGNLLHLEQRLPLLVCVLLPLLL